MAKGYTDAQLDSAFCKSRCIVDHSDDEVGGGVSIVSEANTTRNESLVSHPEAFKRWIKQKGDGRRGPLPNLTRARYARCDGDHSQVALCQ